MAVVHKGPAVVERVAQRFRTHRVTVGGRVDAAPHLRCDTELRALFLGHPSDSRVSGRERACDIHISNLRRKIESNPRNPERLVTVRGVGYTLVSIVSVPTHN